ncbi:MAG: DUF1347 family protein [Chlamydiales bacterium]
MKRIVSIFVFVAVAAGAAFTYHLCTKEENLPQKAFAALKEGEYSAAAKSLEEATQLTFPLALYHSYLAQVQGHFKESEYLLQALLKQPQRTNQQEIFLEAYLSQAVNAYFTHQDEELSPLIDRARRFSSDNPVLIFFEGLKHYLQNQYADALRFWSTFSPEPTVKNSQWLEVVIDRCFPLSWRRLHMAHCLTEEGDILSSREILERENHQLKNDPLHYHQLATLFLGLTYLKEAGEVPLGERDSYYKLANFYFQRAGKNERYEREKDRVVFHLCEEAQKLLTSPVDLETKRWGLTFVHVLQDWSAEEAINSIADHLTLALISRPEAENLQLCQEICSEFQGSFFHSLITEKFLAATQAAAQNQEIESLYYLWSHLAALSPSPSLIAKQVAALTSKELFLRIHEDTENVHATRRYLAFWKYLGQDREECDRMAMQLLHKGELLWRNEGSEEKGTRLMKLAIELSDDKMACRRSVEHFLTTLYAAAENSNMIERLSLIHDALDYFDVTIKDLVCSEKLANHLADAEYLFNARNWAAAKSHASWVLKLDPTNKRALRLVGLSAFHLGDYEKALNLLRGLSTIDATVEKAIAFSEVYSASHNSQHLVQIDNSDHFNEDD